MRSRINIVHENFVALLKVLGAKLTDDVKSQIVWSWPLTPASVDEKLDPVSSFGVSQLGGTV